MSQLENSLETILNVFHQYSSQTPHPDKLNKLKELIEEELAQFLKNQANPPGIDKIFRQLDQNQDEELSVEEFIVMVTKVTIATETTLHSGPGQLRQRRPFPEQFAAAVLAAYPFDLLPIAPSSKISQVLCNSLERLCNHLCPPGFERLANLIRYI
ncbi:protein S100-A12-like [Hemicordylus capensis]|uniref:protein S100-A12-like n=1 Tax=Hemicordylus capensis TaxID=884348 RepID=UPI002304C9FD|nr:protein S100-A12-like [Hemicordylus capensis]